jgi:hypothetical protein
VLGEERLEAAFVRICSTISSKRDLSCVAPRPSCGMNDSAAMDPTSELFTTVTQSGPEPEAATTAASDRGTREAAGTLSCVASATCRAEPAALSARGDA